MAVLAVLLAVLGSPWAFAVAGLLVGLAIFAAALKWRSEVLWILGALALAWIVGMGVYRAGGAACEARAAEIRRAVDAIDKELKADYRAKLDEERKGIDARIKDYVATLPNDCRATRRDVDTVNGILQRWR